MAAHVLVSHLLPSLDNRREIENWKNNYTTECQTQTYCLNECEAIFCDPMQARLHIFVQVSCFGLFALLCRSEGFPRFREVLNSSYHT